MIVEITNYYANPGCADAVLAHRRHGCALRAEMGLPPGRVFVKLSGDGPDVRWECSFESRAAFDADMAARDTSPVFAQQRLQMRDLLQRFERHIQALDAS